MAGDEVYSGDSRAAREAERCGDDGGYGAIMINIPGAQSAEKADKLTAHRGRGKSRKSQAQNELWNLFRGMIRSNEAVNHTLHQWKLNRIGEDCAQTNMR